MSIQASDGDNIGRDLGGVDRWIIQLSQAMEVLVKYDVVISHLELVGIKWVFFQSPEEFGHSALELH